MADSQPEPVGIVPDGPTPDGWVEMTLEGVDKPMTCSPRAVKHWEARGWKRVAAQPAKSRKES